MPPAVGESLQYVTEHGIFGYTLTDAEYDDLIISWYKKRMSWQIRPEWILKVPGVMFAIAASIQALTNPGDAVLICQPVYYPFAKIISSNNRRLVVSELKLNKERYEIDFADMEEKITQNSVKIFLLCSPHNPVGRVWTREELLSIGEICLRHNVIIISDEIHSDFIFNGYHIPIASLSEELADRTITCTSPTKTFNLAGLQEANIIISNERIRHKVQKACLATGYSNLNTMAIAATKAAFDKLYLRAKELGYEYVVTGHYVRIEKDESSGKFLLKKALDSDKDQSYVLYTLTQEQLAHTQFPLGKMTKPEVRSIAEAQNFTNAHKHDSQDICFVRNGSYADFIEEYTGKKYPGGTHSRPSPGRNPIYNRTEKRPRTLSA